VYKLIFTKAARRTLRKIPHDLAQRIRAKVVEIAADPYAQHRNVTKLQNLSGFRLRVGDWRVIYEIHDDELVVVVLKIGSRGDIYGERSNN
jgi:mRNA interferase RelE/StbE